MHYLDRLLSADEHVIMLTRRHGSALLGAVLLSLLLVALIVAAVVATYMLTPVGEIALTGCGLVVLPLAWLAWRITVWQNELFAVTNRRVVQLHGVINKDVADSSLEKVNDLLLRQTLLGRMLNAGDIEILTASEGGINRLAWIARPLDFKAALLDAKHALEHPPLPDSPARPVNDLAGALQSLRHLYDEGLLTPEEYEQKKAEAVQRY